MSRIGENKVAMYWDFENIHWSLQTPDRDNQEIITGNKRYKIYQEKYNRDNERMVDVKAVIDYVSSFGTVIINRAYANWTYFVTYRFLMMENAIDLVQLFHRGPNAKNGADIRIAVDAMDDIHRNEAISHVVIVGGDSDFTGVAQKLREHNMYVIGIGARGTSNSYWVKSCSEFKYYQNILLQIGEATEEDRRELAARGDLIQAKDLLVKAIKRLVPGGLEGFALKAAIKPMMLRLDPSFDEANFGFTSFSSFLQSCQELIVIEQGEHDHLVRLRDSRLDGPEAEKSDTEAADPNAQIQHTLRQINYRLLPPALRLEGLKIIFDLFKKDKFIGNFRTLEEKIIDRFEQTGDGLLETDAKKIREMVYKARGFRFQPPDGVLSLVDEVNTLDDLVMRVDRSIIQRLKDKCPVRLDPESLLWLLYGSNETKLNYIKDIVNSLQ